MEKLDNTKIEFWNKFKRWHLDDIDICLANNANYAATKTMLSLIDSLGGFYGGLIEYNNIYYVPAGGGSRSKKIYDINNKSFEKSGSKKQFLNFTKNYLHEFFETKLPFGKNIRLSDVLYEHFRCGIIHEGQPKFGTGITKENTPIVIYTNYKNIPVVLNILALRDMLRRAVFEYERDLSDNKQPERMIRWQIRYDFLTQLKF
ncbi:MAG: hypothetical protein UR93_C0009G0008 [Berkelbacteria bacterium GW2011_GWA2_35_9]|uniref:Uncharacterized protein n=1 Tax=Berkelbacteria bacterium GW2011_GWA2_35_9 TaxID=1618333 RepID=A0A0G0FMU5_9BACT|nr:MAG: hypothetical protein UR93_C0009G0008 [Berkelbacteria bacterium GW2011_GWA2_35_9]